MNQYDILQNCYDISDLEASNLLLILRNYMKPIEFE